MSSQRVSHAEFSDFNPSSKRMFPGRKSNLLGSGLLPDEGEGSGADLPVGHLHRPRLAHDVLDMAPPDLTSSVRGEGSAPSSSTSSSSQYTTTYQAMQMEGAKRKAPLGKAHAAPLPRGLYGGSGGLASFVGGMAPRISKTGGCQDLQAGTVKNSGHLPGYTGYVPVGEKLLGGGTTRDALNKNLTIENYRGTFGSGYTGKLGK